MSKIFEADIFRDMAGNNILDVKQDKNLKFTDISVTAWESDTTYTDYVFKSDIRIEGVTDTMIAEVIFSHDDSISGKYSPICFTGTDVITIYAKVDDQITIPTIIIFR